MAEKNGFVDPEMQLLKFKKMGSNMVEILKGLRQREDVEDFISTIESVIPIINRVLTQIGNVDKEDLTVITSKLSTALMEYEDCVTKLDKTGKLKRFLTNNRLRKKLETVNAELTKDIETFVEIIVQVEVKASEKASEEEKRVQTIRLQQLADQMKHLRNPTRESFSGSFMEGPQVNPALPYNGDLDFDIEELLKLPAHPPDFEVYKARYVSFLPLIELSPDVFKDDWELEFGMEV